MECSGRETRRNNNERVTEREKATRSKRKTKRNLEKKITENKTTESETGD